MPTKTLSVIIILRSSYSRDFIRSIKVRYAKANTNNENFEMVIASNIGFSGSKLVHKKTYFLMLMSIIWKSIFDLINKLLPKKLIFETKYFFIFLNLNLVLLFFGI